MVRQLPREVTRSVTRSEVPEYLAISHVVLPGMRERL